MDSNQNHHKEIEPFIEQIPNNVQNQRRKKILKNPKLWIGLVFLLIIAVTIISLVLYSSVYSDADEQNLMNLSSDSKCSYLGFVNVTTDHCLWDSWIKNETVLQERITSLYSMSPFLNYFFIAAKVNYNLDDEDKSAVINLDFAQPSMKYLISTELVEGVLRQDMYDLEKSVCQDSQILKDSLQISVMSM